ncbi:MAG: hypothetical protein RLZZ618_2459 [Pseudomonadota bacterium]
MLSIFGSLASADKRRRVDISEDGLCRFVHRPKRTHGVQHHVHAGSAQFGRRAHGCLA